MPPSVFLEQSLKFYMENWRLLSRIMAPVAFASFVLWYSFWRAANGIRVIDSSLEGDTFLWSAIIRRDSILVVGFLANWILYLFAFAVIVRSVAELERGGEVVPAVQFGSIASRTVSFWNNSLQMTVQTGMWVVSWFIGFVLILVAVSRVVSIPVARMPIYLVAIVTLIPMSLPLSAVCLRFAVATLEGVRFQGASKKSEQLFQVFGYSLATTLSLVTLGALALPEFLFSDFVPWLYPYTNKFMKSAAYDALYQLFFSFASSMIWTIFMISCALVVHRGSPEKSSMPSSDIQLD